jgi:hypothetical protein
MPSYCTSGCLNLGCWTQLLIALTLLLQDALPIDEPDNLVAGQLGFRSTVSDTGHMCGHDSHMSMLLGAAR